MSGLLGGLPGYLAQFFTGEQLGEPSQRTEGEAARTAMAGLLGVAQGLQRSGALSPSYSPVQPGVAQVMTAGLSGGLEGATAAEIFNFQGQQAAIQRAQMLREQARRQQVRALLGQIATGGMAPAGTGQAPGAPAQGFQPGQDAAPAEPMSAPAPAPALPAELGPDTIAQLPALSAAPQPMRDIFGSAVLEAGLTPEQANVYARMIQRESGWRHTRDNGEILTSRVGARGIGQVMPGTFAEVAQRRSIDGPIDDPLSNMRAGAWYFRQMLDEFGGDLSHAVAAYNAGPRRMRDVIAGRAQLPQETRGYLANVMGPPASPRAEAPTVALSTAANVPRPVAESLLGLTPQDAMLLLMLDDEQAGKAITEILKQRHQGGGYELLTTAQARELGLPNPDTQRYQRSTGGESRGRISEVGGGQTRITIDQRGEDRLQALDIERLGRVRQGVEAGQAIVPQLQAMQQSILAGTETGPSAAARAAIGNYLVGLGVMSREQVAQLNNARLFQSLVATVVPQMRPVGSGSTSDRDLALFQQAAPSLVNTEIGNLLIAGAMTQVREAQGRQVEQMEDFLRSQRGSLAGYADFSRRNPIAAFPRLTDDAAGEQMAAGLTPGTVVVLPSGRLGVKLPDGSFDVGDGQNLQRYRRSQPQRRP